MAEIFEVTVDELTRENGAHRPEAMITDSELLAQFHAISQLGQEEINAVKFILQAIIANQQVKKLMRV